MNYVLIAFCISLAISLALTPIARRIALKVGCMDPVVHRSVHQQPKPYLGGVAIFAAFMGASLWALGGADRELVGILLCGALIFLIGLLDDLKRPRGIPASLKFLLQAAVAALSVIVFDVKIDYMRIDWIRSVFGLPLGDSPYLFFGGWAYPLSIFWLVAFTNVVNLIDGLDGLAAGITTIGALTLLIIALGQGDVTTMVMTAALAGATTGFLKYNFNPASIIMGDAGSLFLGYTMGAVAIYGVLKTPLTIGIAVPLLALGLPIFDTTFAILRRVRSGRSIGEADKDHLHHRLLRLGLSHRNTVLIMWAISAWLGISAVAVTALSAGEALAVVLLVLAVTVYGANRMGLLKMEQHRTQDHSGSMGD